MRIVHTLRFRVAVWYAAILSIVLATFGGLLYAHVRYQLVGHHDAALLDAVREARAILSQASSLDALSAGQRSRLDGLRYVLVRPQEGGEVLYRSPGPSVVSHRVEVDVLALSVPDGGAFDILPGAAGPLRMYSAPHRLGSGRRTIIHVIEDIGDVSVSLASLRLSILLMAPLAVLFSAASGYWVAGRALAPVDRVTRAAREIEASSLSRRLPHPRGQDEIARLVETFNQLIARLETSFDGMKRFTADAAHELRGPLTTMRGAIDVALSKPRPAAELESVLASVGEDVDRLRAIAEDLLVLARADAGRIVLESVPVRLDVIAGEVAESLSPVAASLGLVLEARTGTPATVAGDERWLRQLVFNLLDNAIKFSGDPSARRRGTTVAVDVEVADDAVTLRVADCGPGIPPAALEHVFERFYRADDARTSRGEQGFGLGLSIAAWIVEAHGGRIKATSRVEGGSLFSVSLPLLSPPQ